MKQISHISWQIVCFDLEAKTKHYSIGKHVFRNEAPVRSVWVLDWRG
jgi:hypothetical protein